MKRIVLAMFMAVAGLVTAHAQFRVGGGLGVNIDVSEDDNTKTYVYLTPEFAWAMNDKWEFGGQLSLSSTTEEVLDKSRFGWSLTPYARFTFYRTGKVAFFCDGFVTIGGGKYSYEVEDGHDVDESGTAVGVGLRPGISFDLNEHLCLQSTFGALSYTSNDDYVAGMAPSGFGFNMNNGLNLSLFYRF